MTHQIANPTKNSLALQLKAETLTLTVMEINNPDLSALVAQLNKLGHDVANFFNQAPIIIDLAPVRDIPRTVDFEKLLPVLKRCGLVAVGVCQGSPEQMTAAAQAGLGLLNFKTKAIVPDQQSPHPPKDALVSNSNTMVVAQPVRSGQRIHAKGGDLVVLSSVGAGAEVLADGHIHIYGTLRGRALAGTMGDTTARIYCRRLEAEMVAIAGQYQLSDTLTLPEGEYASVQVYLNEEGIITITAI